MKVTTINPTTGDPMGVYPEISSKKISQMIEDSHLAFKDWRETSFDLRAKCMKAAASNLLSKREFLAKLMALEMGKPIRAGRSEIEKCAWACDYFAQNSRKFLRQEIVKTEAYKSYIAYEPLGVILAIMPWNFPFWQVFRAAVPALMAGNAMLLKHASSVPACALAIENVFEDAGFPPALFRTLLLGSKRIPPLIKNPRIQGITLTGSTNAGKSVAAEAGKYIKKCVLELGGSDPYVILEDAHLEKAAAICATSRLHILKVQSPTRMGSIRI